MNMLVLELNQMIGNFLNDDIKHYQKIISTSFLTSELMQQSDFLQNSKQF